jgi:hypothetical protein
MYTQQSWKWSTGEAYYKSARIDKNDLKQELQEQNLSYDSQINAINQSLADESFFNQDSDLINITNSLFSRNQNASGTRREDLDTKIADREMIAQRGVNPFLQTSYVNDVVARDMFLKPINTTFGKEKEEDKDKDKDK